MAFGLGRLRWTPEAFWAATPREISAALQSHGRVRGEAMAREALAQLMMAHPDR